ncbi:hypothetical protein HYX02_03845 [Candidatus Woesearchaeota archaeon]|nr:hypothetical protein [Candidatus Woesearchaeota archaeon]
MGNLGKITRGDFLERLAGAAASVSLPNLIPKDSVKLLSLENLMNELSAQAYGAPDYHYVKLDDGRLVPADFYVHILDWEKNRRNIGGVDTKFKPRKPPHGAPVVSPVRGVVVQVDNFIIVEYGIVRIKLDHLEKILIPKGKDIRVEVKRGQILGLEGDHTQLSVSGVTLERGLTYDYDYLDRFERNEDRWKVWRTVVNPARLAIDKVGPVHKFPFKYKLDGEDYDTPYLNASAKVKSGLEKLAEDFGNTEIGRSIGASLKGNRPIPIIINYAVGMYPKVTDKALRTTLTDIFADVKEAFRLLKLTSIYIDHVNPDVIAEAVKANSNIVDYLRPYYRIPQVQAYKSAPGKELVSSYSQPVPRRGFLKEGLRQIASFARRHYRAA